MTGAPPQQVPDPVPAGTQPSSEELRAAAMAAAAAKPPLVWRCPVCWTAIEYPAGTEPPASIDQHAATCRPTGAAAGFGPPTAPTGP